MPSLGDFAFRVLVVYLVELARPHAFAAILESNLMWGYLNHATNVHLGRECRTRIVLDLSDTWDLLCILNCVFIFRSSCRVTSSIHQV